MRAGSPTGPALAMVAVLAAAAALAWDVVMPSTMAGTIEPLEVARRIRASEPGLDVVDTRDAADFEAGHIPTARNVPLVGIGAIVPEPGETVVLYDAAGGLDARAVAALSPDGKADVRVLERGITGWMDDVMAPRLADDASDAERAAFAEQAELSRWFGGLPRIVSAETIRDGSREESPERTRRLLGGC